MEPEQQEALSELLDRNREGQLNDGEANQLNELIVGLPKWLSTQDVSIESGC